MDTAWRFRFMLFVAFAVIIFGDMIGYGNVNGEKNSNSNHRRQSVDSLKNNRPNIELNDGKLNILIFLCVVFLLLFYILHIIQSCFVMFCYVSLCLLFFF